MVLSGPLRPALDQSKTSPPFGGGVWATWLAPASDASSSAVGATSSTWPKRPICEMRAEAVVANGRRN